MVGLSLLTKHLNGLLEATNTWSVNIDNSFLNGIVFINLKNAFDKIDHEIILRKLLYFGAVQATIKWFQSDLCQLRALLLVAYGRAASWVPCFFQYILTIFLTACGMLRRECLLMALNLTRKNGSRS